MRERDGERGNVVCLSHSLINPDVTRISSLLIEFGSPGALQSPVIDDIPVQASLLVQGNSNLLTHDILYIIHTFTQRLYMNCTSTYVFVLLLTLLLYNVTFLFHTFFFLHSRIYTTYIM